MRESCAHCAMKHIAQALVLVQEERLGYPLHRWLAAGHMAEASDELILNHPELAMRVRAERLNYMEDSQYVPDLMSIIEDLDLLLGTATAGS